MFNPSITRARAQTSRAAIERLYIAMRHLFVRGSYKPLGVSGEAIIESLMQVEPEIYGNIRDPEKVELEGLNYVFQRLPRGIEECRFIRLISREGFENSDFQPIIASKRRRNSYRIDQEQMFIEMTRGRSDVYDILTHLTFMYIEAEKIRRNSEDHRGRKKREWLMLGKIITKLEKGEDFNKARAFTYLSTLLGRTYNETLEACNKFEEAEDVNNLFHIAYHLGLRSFDELEDKDREISFSSALREKIGHHQYGEMWADKIKAFLDEQNLLERPLHIISANLHSVMNCFYASQVLKNKNQTKKLSQLAEKLSDPANDKLRKKVKIHALKNGMHQIDDTSGTNISVQVFDTSKIDPEALPPEIKWDKSYLAKKKPVLLVMDYAFGEQAYETMDELLKAYEKESGEIPLKVESISVMGKAGILYGNKGDIMVPTAHVFEGTADNYPFKNKLKKSNFEGKGVDIYEGPMVTVLGTSLQNKDILEYFQKSSWNAIGLEMEGAHYQKAIQAASKIRKSITEDVAVRYAYYASDNPLLSGQTLTSGSLGIGGVKPTYLITLQILNQILKG